VTAHCLDLTDQQTAAFERQLKRCMAQLERRIRGAISRLDIVDGVIVKTPANLQFVASMTPQLNAMLEQSGYPELIAHFQDGDAELLAAVRSSSAVPLAFTRQSSTTLAALQGMQNSQFIGIGTSAMEAVRQSVMNTIMTGARLEDAIDVIKAQIDGKLKSYAWTYANTTRRDVVQLANDLAAEQIDGDLYWAYNGPLDDVTRPACQDLLAIGVFTDAERAEAEAMYAAEREYNCRHSFDLISQSQYNELNGGQ
jgi:hypothetical protein